jgi:hypothetical protein
MIGGFSWAWGVILAFISFGIVILAVLLIVKLLADMDYKKGKK